MSPESAASWNFVRTKPFNFTSASRRRANEVLTVLLPVVLGRGGGGGGEEKWKMEGEGGGEGGRGGGGEGRRN